MFERFIPPMLGEPAETRAQVAGVYSAWVYFSVDRRLLAIADDKQSVKDVLAQAMEKFGLDEPTSYYIGLGDGKGFAPVCILATRGDVKSLLLS